MRRCPTLLVPLLTLSILWMSIPQGVSAQEVTSTPELLTPAPAGTELSGTVTPAAVGISSPLDGAVLSGVVDLRGTTFSAWDLSFSYQDDPTGAWFPLAQSSDPVSEGSLATWDTTAITDGFYVLRLRVSAADGSQVFKINVRVLNYSPVETATPTLTATLTVTPTSNPIISPAGSGMEATIAATLTPAVSPTMSGPLPPNPAMLSPQAIAVNFGKGVLAVIALFVFFGLLLSISRKVRA